MYTLPPFFRYSPAISAVRWKATRLCHSVRSCQLPSLSLTRSVVASENRATAMPACVYFTSGSLPRLPIRMTLLTLFAISGSPADHDHLGLKATIAEAVSRQLSAVSQCFAEGDGARCSPLFVGIPFALEKNSRKKRDGRASDRQQLTAFISRRSCKASRR